VKRLLTIYAACFVATMLLFAAYAPLASGAVDEGAWQPIWRMVLFVLGVASGVATWGAAIWLATVHRKAWPLIAAVLTVCAATTAVVVRHGLAG
jgi:hypothetical protein